MDNGRYYIINDRVGRAIRAMATTIELTKACLVFFQCIFNFVTNELVFSLFFHFSFLVMCLDKCLWWEPTFRSVYSQYILIS